MVSPLPDSGGNPPQIGSHQLVAFLQAQFASQEKSIERLESEMEILKEALKINAQGLYEQKYENQRVTESIERFGKRLEDLSKQHTKDISHIERDLAEIQKQLRILENTDVKQATQIQTGSWVLATMGAGLVGLLFDWIKNSI